ncbi:MAG: hypothetical protein KF809_03780 [Chloroflexi bacterium]|nr:hypothetical protein [Chloroflexota bacterium]
MDLDPAPPYYPNAVTTSSDDRAAQLAAIERMLAGPLPRPWTIKDGFHGRLDGRIVAVAVASRSAAGTGPVVGISNIVLGEPDGERYRGALIDAVRDAFPGLPLVGYERGEDLERMIGLGLEAVGPLRVWIMSR